MAFNPDRHLRRLAERSSLHCPEAPKGFQNLSAMVAAFPCRTAIAMPVPGKPNATARDLPPITGAIALLPGVPFDGQELAQAVDEARTALAAGGTFLILAANEAQRDDAKARIVAALGILISPTTAGGRA